MYFLYNTSSGAIVAANTTGFTAGTGEAVLGPLTDNTAGAAFANPDRFLVVSGALSAQPYLVLTTAVASGVATLAATLNDAPASPPASVTFTVAGNTFTETLTSGAATLTVDIHASVATFAIPASVAATGCVGASVTFGGTAQAPVQLQCAPLVGGTVPTVSPCGVGSDDFLQAFRGTSSIPQAHVIGDLGTADSVALDGLIVLLKQATGLTTAQQNSLAWLETNVQPYLPVTFTNMLDSSGKPIQPAAQYAADQALAATAFGAYANDLATLTNLA